MQEAEIDAVMEMSAVLKHSDFLTAVKVMAEFLPEETNKQLGNALHTQAGRILDKAKDYPPDSKDRARAAGHSLDYMDLAEYMLTYDEPEEGTTPDPQP